MLSRILLTFTGFSLCFALSAMAVENEQLARAYIAEYKSIALEEMQQYGIPASIKLAQALVETNCGTSELSRNANNHFGIKCKRTWTGDTYRYTDDAPDECFRKYDSAEASFRDHSKFLRYHYYNNYDHLFELSMYDYKAWAQGLLKAGYATNQRYAELLIQKIEYYDLYMYDTQILFPYLAQLGGGAQHVRLGQISNYHSEHELASLSKSEKKALHAMTVAREEEKPSVQPAVGKPKANEPTAAPKASNPKPIARKPKAESKPKGKTIAQKKAQAHRDNRSTQEQYEDRYQGTWQPHVVQSGETLATIARKYDIRVSQLRRFNRLKSGEEPRAGETLILNRKNPKKPKLR